MSGVAGRVALRLGALDLDVEVAVPAGSTVAVVGRNGAGKTTLLRALAGLVPLDQGRLEVGGTVVDDPATGTWVAPERRAVGFLFQEHRLFPHLSVLDNVAFGLRARGVRRAEARTRAEQELGAVGLADRAGDRPGALSGGQAQRVALARALALDPGVLLLDEPLAALDATVRGDLRHALRERLAGHPAARVVVTHDPVDAAALAHEVLVLDGGRVVQAGTPAALAAAPRTPYVADLMGVNLLRGRWAGADAVALDGGAEVAVAAPVAGGEVRPVGGEVFVVVPPSAVTLHPERPVGSARNAWPLTVARLDEEPGRVRVVTDGPLRLVAEVTASAVAELGLAPGTPVWAAVKATEVTASNV